MPGSTSGDRTIGVALVGHLAVINAGPAPLTVRDVFVNGSGIVLHTSTPGSPTAPGKSAKFAFDATLGCPVDSTLAERTATVSVETADKALRQTTVTFNGHARLQEVRAACKAHIEDLYPAEEAQLRAHR